MSQYVPYSNHRKDKLHRRQLRRHATKAETLLWKHIRNKQLGVIFRRQYSIGKYIVDFFCYEIGLIIEIDGGIHGEEAVQEKDRKREAWLQARGYTIVRYTNAQVLDTTEHVYTDLQRIVTQLSNNLLPL